VEVAFWLAASLVFYAYAGYPALIVLAATLRPRGVARRAGHTPDATVLVVVNDEEAVIAAKLDNLLCLDYPKDRLQIVVVSDGSIDRTDEIVKDYAARGVELMAVPGPRGKAAALNQAVPHARGEMLVLTDARQPLAPDAVRALASYLADPTVGAVSGEMHLVAPSEGGVKGVGLYWNYEKLIRRAESRFDSTVGVTGAFYAVRKELFVPLDPRTILDDVALPMEIAMRGYRVVFAPEARAWDEVAATPSREYRRKVRTLAGNYQLVSLRPALLDPLRNRLFWQFVSHKMARLAVPFGLLATAATSLGLALLGSRLYLGIFALQALFYALAAAGGLRAEWGLTPVRILSLPHTFVMMNLAAVLSLRGFLGGTETANWKAPREARPAGDRDARAAGAIDGGDEARP
jgi:cellulose synthase/poly-beta-1,6-N-acetylglucosamine synthase-like glycosyltransferase